MASALLRRRTAGITALAWLACAALAPATAHAKVYFSAFFARGGTGVERAAFDGGELEALQFQPAGFADGLALDAAGGKMYWTDTFASVIWSANLNGSDAQIVLDDFGEEPLGIALDVAGGKMYFTDAAGVKRASLSGGEEELLTKSAARGFIALDLSARRMYWADWPSGVVKTAAMSREPEVKTVVSKQPAPFGVALDPGAGKIYWLQLEVSKGKGERDVIRRASLNGSGVQTLVERTSAGFEGGIAIDPAAGKLYWSEAEARDIGVANLDGSQARTLFSTGLDIPEGLAIETANPHPRNTAPPFIEGLVRVGSPLACQPGAWTGTGPISFAYQWSVLNGATIEGATGATYVPPTELAGQQLVCAVSATDDVDTSTAASAAVTVSPLPAPVPTLVAGIALAHLTAFGTSARVPVFTSLPGAAGLEAKPMLGQSRARSRHGRGPGLRSPRATVAHKARPTGPRRRSGRSGPRTVAVSRSLPAGRSTITLHGLFPGTTYRLVLTIATSDGQSARATAILRVRRR